MDAPAAESELASPARSWIARARADARTYDYAAAAIAVVLVVVAAFSAWLLTRDRGPGSLLSTFSTH